MTAHADYDVAIIGGSIAGCAAAIFFARRGLTVALIERQRDPLAYKKICTHFIQPSATPTIERLGIAREIEAAGGVRNGVEIWTRWGWIRTPAGDVGGHPTYGYSIRREVLDPLLRRRAADTPGVDLILGANAQRLLREGGRFTGAVVSTDQDQGREIRARLLVAADGRNSRIAELAGVKAQVKPHRRFMYFAYYRQLPLASGTNSQIWFDEPDVGYAFPNDDGLTLLGCFVHADKLASFKRDLRQNFEQFFQDLPLAPDIAAAERASEVLGMLEMPNQLRPAAHDGLALIGDAALASDPLWGVGCGWALQSAEWLADETAHALLAGGDLDQALERYRARHRSALGLHHFLITDFSTGRPFNLMERLVMSAAANDQATAQHFGLFGARSIGVKDFLAPKALARALWVVLRQRMANARAARDAA